MTLFPLGGIYLDEVRFSTDPETYEFLNWEKRYSVTPTIGGRVTIQDFGTFMKDDEIRLASGRAGFLDQTTVIALHTRFRTKGATYTFRDWLQNEATVFILKFVPIVFKRSLYTYTMELKATSIVKLWGTSYVGS